jgi:hypothetical protein
MSAPVFVATFSDGAVTRMSIFITDPNKLDLARGIKLARYACQSRTGKEPPAFTKAHFEQPDTGEILATYSAIELNDDDEGEPTPTPAPAPDDGDEPTPTPAEPKRRRKKEG